MANIINGNRASTGNTRGMLAKVPFFTEAPRELQAALLAAASVVRLEAGAYFLREGDSCANFAIVVSGRMRVFKLGETGHEITLYHVGAGEACPLNVSCILSDRPVPAMAQVEEAVDAVVIPAGTFRRLMAEYESLRTFVFQMFSSRLTEVMSLVEEVAFRRMDQRLARHLEQWFLADGGRQGTIEVTHAQIAADLGTAREVVSRLLKVFERIGAISLSRGRILLRDRALLRELTAGDAE
jgi:CRP/FNR family transcriptional regulator